MEQVIIEMRPAEGGEDSILLVDDMFKMYSKACSKNGFEILNPSWKGKTFCMTVKGKGCRDFFLQECGGHRWQRVPPTERRGRVHTSTVTVACLVKGGGHLLISDSDLRWETFRSGGKGGQHQNKTESGCRVTHIPTGISASSRTKSQYQNKKIALENLKQNLQELENSRISSELRSNRSEQIGSGMRGDKIRTYNVPRDTVTDHVSGKKLSLKKVMLGDIKALRA